MKVKDLIEILQKCDPEAPVCEGGNPIRVAEEIPCYWDGHPAEVEGGKTWRYITEGKKVRLTFWDKAQFLEEASSLTEGGDLTPPPFEEFIELVENLPEGRRARYTGLWKAAHKRFKEEMGEPGAAEEGITVDPDGYAFSEVVRVHAEWIGRPYDRRYLETVLLDHGAYVLECASAEEDLLALLVESLGKKKVRGLYDALWGQDRSLSGKLAEVLEKIEGL
jgi:hypothetical protein